MINNSKLEAHLKNTIFLDFDKIRDLKFNSKALEQFIKNSPTFGILSDDPEYGDMYTYFGFRTVLEELMEDDEVQFSITKNDIIVLPIESDLFSVVTNRTLYQVVVAGFAPTGFHNTLKNYCEFTKKLSNHPKFKNKKWLKEVRDFPFTLWYDDDLQKEVLQLNQDQLNDYLSKLK